MYPWPAIWRAKRATGPVTGGICCLTALFWDGYWDLLTLVDLAEDDNAWKYGTWVILYRRMKDVYAYDDSEGAYLIGTAALTHASHAICRSRHILMALGD